jgi:hypothetical protein
MAWTKEAQAGVFKVDVATTSNGGHPPDFWAKLCADRILNIADSAPPEIKDQAIAYKGLMEQAILLYMKRAIQSDRTTVGYALSEAGHPKLAEMLRSF